MSEARDGMVAAFVGAVAGALATLVMSVPMVAARRAGLLPSLPPHDITDEVVERTSMIEGISGTDRRALGWAAHVAFGILAGALYALLRWRTRPAIGDPATGVAFALSVWTVSYLGWVPALGALPSAVQDRPGRPATMITAHVVFGLVLGQLLGRWRSQDRA
jgi:hypothetical protein